MVAGNCEVYQRRDNVKVRLLLLEPIKLSIKRYGGSGGVGNNKSKCQSRSNERTVTHRDDEQTHAVFFLLLF